MVSLYGKREILLRVILKAPFSVERGESKTLKVAVKSIIIASAGKHLVNGQLHGQKTHTTDRPKLPANKDGYQTQKKEGRVPTPLNPESTEHQSQGGRNQPESESLTEETGPTLTQLSKDGSTTLAKITLQWQQDQERHRRGVQTTRE